MAADLPLRTSILLLDAAVIVFQPVCFPIYGIPRVRRKDYLVFDRGGLLAMITEIAARTEQQFCPIKRARRLLQTHSRYGTFLPYGDARGYR